jgi:hypothetical protein
MLDWPVIRRFTEAVVAEDRFAVEAEQRAYDTQGADWNQEILPFILGLRSLMDCRRRADRPDAAAPHSGLAETSV